MSKYTTGVAACDQLNEFHIKGNIVSPIWFKTIVKDKLQNPKPHFLAINILSEIVYWYRPTEVLDKKSGQILRLKKKFNSNLLQRSYDELAATYGCSNDTVKEAVVFLEKLGVIYRELRDITIGGKRCNNIMYLGLNVDRLKELTYTSMEVSTVGAGKSPHRGMEVSTVAEGESSRTNTKNTKTNISSKNTPSIYPANTEETKRSTLTDQLEESDRLNEEKLLDEVKRELMVQKAVPYHYQREESRMLIAIRSLTDWYELKQEHFYSEKEFSFFRTMVDCLAEMAYQKKAHTYNGSCVSNGCDVIKKINEYLVYDRNLFYVIEEALDDFKTAEENNTIKNARSYMKSVIWTRLCAYHGEFESKFAHTYS